MLPRLLTIKDGAKGILSGNMDLAHSLTVSHREHHEKKTFREEYIELLEQFDIDFDNKYLFEFLD